MDPRSEKGGEKEKKKKKDDKTKKSDKSRKDKSRHADKDSKDDKSASNASKLAVAPPKVFRSDADAAEDARRWLRATLERAGDRGVSASVLLALWGRERGRSAENCGSTSAAFRSRKGLGQRRNAVRELSEWCEVQGEGQSNRETVTSKIRRWRDSGGRVRQQHK